MKREKREKCVGKAKRWRGVRRGGGYESAEGGTVLSVLQGADSSMRTLLWQLLCCRAAPFPVG